MKGFISRTESNSYTEGGTTVANVEDYLGEGGALAPKSPKKKKLSLRSILREVLDADEKKLAKKVIEFMIRKLLANSKIENPQIAKLIMEHIDGKPTQTIVEMGAPDDLFDGLETDELLQMAGFSLVDPESGDLQPRSTVQRNIAKRASDASAAKRKAAKKKKKKKAKTRRGSRGQKKSKKNSEKTGDESPS